MAEHCADFKNTSHFLTNSVDEYIKKYDLHSIPLLTGLPEGDTKDFFETFDDFTYKNNQNRLVLCLFTPF